MQTYLQNNYFGSLLDFIIIKVDPLLSQSLLNLSKLNLFWLLKYLNKTILF